MNMQATNTEALLDTNLHKAKRERMAQWMADINNNQKNAEILTSDN